MRAGFVVNLHSPLWRVTHGAISKADWGKDAANIILPKDAVSGRKGDPGNCPSSKFLTLTCRVYPESYQIGKKEQIFLSFSYCLLFPLKAFQLEKWD